MHLNLAWHRLDAWPDVRPGLDAPARAIPARACSNGNISLMVDLARRNGFPWDAILGAEIARDYKPKPIVYLAAVEAFDCAPDEVMMVAAHPSDLAAAAHVGLRTAFIERPNEFGPGRGDSARHRDRRSCGDEHYSAWRTRSACEFSRRQLGPVVRYNRPRVIPRRSSSRRPTRRGGRHDEYRDTRSESRPPREPGRDILDDTLIRFSHLEEGRREVLDASGIGVVIIDMERNVRYANRAALDMLGLAGYDGITLDSIFRDEAAREILQRQLADRKSGFLGNYSVQAYRPDGDKVPLEITGLPIPDEHGVVVGSLGLFRNVEQQVAREPDPRDQSDRRRRSSPAERTG